jgi:hypothetical protein
MIEQAQNKSMGAPDESADAPTTVTAVSRMLNSYHFAGSGIYKPLSIIADSIADATEVWKLKRELVEPAEKTNNE